MSKLKRWRLVGGRPKVAAGRRCGDTEDQEEEFR